MSKAERMKTIRRRGSPGRASRTRKLPGRPVGARRRSFTANPPAYAGGSRGRRDGSTLVIVIALLAILALLALVAYFYSAQERSNAEYFAEAAKARQESTTGADVYFDWGLRQLIIGPRRNEVNSALWGGRASLVPSVLGYVPNQNANPPAGSAAAFQPFLLEAHPYNGEGINLFADASGNPLVDQNYNNDGSDDDQTLLDYNLSPVAHNGNHLNPTDPGIRPQPDVGFTYPGINNLYLAYDGFGLQQNGVRRRVIIPSFHPPQYLREFAQWWGDPADPADDTTARRLFRPHPSHVDANTGALLYVLTQAEADSTPGITKPFPFRPADVADATQNGQMGVWTNSGNSALDETYELDVDNDRDPASIKEGVWLYLGFPLQELPDGTQFVPVHSFTVYDADALLNLNVHGNSKLVDTMLIDGGAFVPNGSSTGYISQSRQGLDPGEINPEWGLHADPASGTLPSIYQEFFGRTPINHRELANMEYFFLTRGRPEFSSGQGTQSDVSDLLPGRYGEPGLYFPIPPSWPGALRTSPGAPMQAGDFPKAGITASNDQQNSPWEESQEMPPFGHPLAYEGLGRYTRAGNFKLVDVFPPPALVGNPSAWIRYSDYRLRNGIRWDDRFPGLTANVSAGAEIDEAMETIFDRELAQSPDDAIFGPDETATLQLSNTALAAGSVTLRSRQLMPFSFEADGDDYGTRRRFTADSWDRKQYGLPLDAKRTWEWDTDNDGPGDGDGDGIGDEFPPVFSNAAAGSDPFRPDLRSLLRVSFGQAQAGGNVQYRLDINRLLDLQNGGYRKLRPHDQNATASVLSLQEQNARRDRQLLARDIYVLLYTFGGGHDALDYTTANTPTGMPGERLLYDDDQLREMAQFAVNLVDRLDRDGVITQFEYDKNLADGWNLDDVPYHDTGDSAAADRAVVYGVEAQQLTMSEALVIKAARVEDPNLGTPQNHQATEYDDTEDRYFTYVELRNASPQRVNFNETWQLGVRPQGEGNSTLPALERRLTLLSGFVPAGGLYEIGAAGDDHNRDPMSGTLRPSYFRVDPNWQQGQPPNFQRIAPRTGLDLDLVTAAGTGVYRLTDGNGTQLTPVPGQPAGVPQRGSLVDVNNADSTNVSPIEFVIYRRLNPGLPQLTDDTLNPWIAVDRMRVGSVGGGVSNGGQRIFNLDPSTDRTTTPSINDELAELRSRFRPQPFELEIQETDTPVNNAGTAMVPVLVANTVGNNNQGGTFTRWQPHFDRDFATVGELLSIPLYGPDEDSTRAGYATHELPFASQTPLQQAQRTPPATAAARFLQPQHPFAFGMDGQPGNATIDDDGDGTIDEPDERGAALSDDEPLTSDNRWHRLLELVEVATRTHRHREFGNPLNEPRVPGKLQLNTLRHPEALAALVDDTNLADFPAAFTGGALSGPSFLPDSAEGANRDWWRQFLEARDGIDPITNLILPGTPVSRPFRSLAFAARGNQSLNDTLLRDLPADVKANGPEGNNRHLLEIGTETEHQNGTVDPYVRDSLLSKVIGNTTTRSHVFVVFVSVDFFEATEVDIGGGQTSLKIGGRLDDSSVEHRAVFVIDRSQIEKMLDPNTGRIDPEQWRRLVQYRLVIE